MGQYWVPVASVPNTPMTEIVAYWMSHDFGEGLKLMEHSWAGGRMVTLVTRFLYTNPHRLVWAGDYADEEPEGQNLYSMTKSKGKAAVVSAATPRYLVNHTKLEYVDLADCPVATYFSTSPSIIHPLPLLTAEGNGRGGGDFHEGIGMKYVGRWARDVIATTSDFPWGMPELRPDFVEQGAVIVPMGEEQVLAEFYGSTFGALV